MIRPTLIAGLLLVAGCGPAAKPIPERPNGGERPGGGEAGTPAGEDDRQFWLDVFVERSASEIGVNQLTFRGRKELTGGTVAMDAHFDWDDPGADRFVVTITDSTGRVVRTERYGRDDVERTVVELNPVLNDSGSEADRLLHTLAFLGYVDVAQKRRDRVEAVWPNDKP